MLSKSRQRVPDPERQGHADGRAAAPLLDAGAALRRTARARRAAEEDQDAGRGPPRLPRQRRAGRHRRAALPASRRRPLLRPQRGMRHPLRLPWLEVRRRRQLRRPADLAAGVLLQGDDQAARLSDARMGRHRLGLHGPARAHARAAAARDGPGAGLEPLRHQEVAGLQLGAERRRRARHGALLVPACRAGQGRGHGARRARQGRDRRPVQARRPHPLDPQRPAAQIHRARPRRRPADRRGAQDRRGRSLLAHLAVPDAQPRLHADRVPRRDLLRPVLGAGRRRDVLDLHLLLAARPPVQQCRAHQVRRRLQRPCRGRRRLHAAAQPAQRLPDRPQGAEARDLHRHRRRERAGRRDPGQHGPDPGPHARASRADRRRRRRVPQAADGRGARAADRRRRPRRRTRRAATPCAPAAGSPRRTRTSTPS